MKAANRPRANTNINNENQDRVGDDSVNNVTRGEVGVGYIQLRETLTLALKLQQGLALVKLLDIMNSEQKTVREWPVCQRSHAYKDNLH